jgi:hypothetical protein
VNSDVRARPCGEDCNKSKESAGKSNNTDHVESINGVSVANGGCGEMVYYHAVHRGGKARSPEQEMIESADRKKKRRRGGERRSVIHGGRGNFDFGVSRLLALSSSLNERRMNRMNSFSLSLFFFDMNDKLNLRRVKK